jgi:hypothetical protein
MPTKNGSGVVEVVIIVSGLKLGLASIYSQTHELYLMKRVMCVNASGVLREKQTRRGNEGEVDVEAVEDATGGPKLSAESPARHDMRTN